MIAINPKTIRSYLQKLQKQGESPSLILKKLTIVDKFLTWAYKKNLIEADTFKQIKNEIDKIKSKIEDKKLKEETILITESQKTTPSIVDFEKAAYAGEKKTEGIFGEISLRFNLQTYKIKSFIFGWLKSLPLLGKKTTSKETEEKEKKVASGFDFSNLGIHHYIGLLFLLVFLGFLGAGIYNKFFLKVERPLAYPSSLTRGGRVLSFQGRLTDSLGNPITTATNVQFKLYNVSTGGTALYTAGPCSITPDQDGIFSTLIGSNCGSEIPHSVFTENPNIYLGVTVGADSEMTPRQPIANVGYAINAETLQGFPPGEGTSNIPFINKDGNLLIAVASPGIRSTFTSADFTLSSAKTAIIQSAGTGDVVLQATESGVLRFRTGGNNDSYTRMIINNGGNVGIGTTSPNQTLSVAGTLGILEGGTSPQYYTIFQGGDQTADITYTLPTAIVANGFLKTDASGVLSWTTNITANSLKWNALTDPDGNLTLNHGTYTTTFNTSSTTGTFFTINANSLTSGKGLYLSSTSTSLTGNLAEFVLSGSNASNTGNVVRIAQTGTSSAAVPLMITNLGTGLSFRVNDETGDNDTTPFVIDASGNVGIGTTNPSTFKLEVAGSVGPSVDNTYDLGSSSLRWANIYGTNIYGNITPTGFTQGSVIFAGAGGTLSQDNANFFWDDANNRLGIGTAAPSQTLEVVGSIALQNSNILTGVTNYVRFSQGISVGGADTYYFNSSGNINANLIGVGTATPNTSRNINSANTFNDISGSGFYNTITTSGTITADRTSYGIYNLITNNADQNQFNLTLRGIYSEVNNANGYSADTIYGGQFYALNQSTYLNPDLNVTATNSAGLVAQAINDVNGTITNQYGIQAYSRNDEGTITNSWGLDAYSFANVAGGTITTSYGVRGRSYVTAGTITTGYGGYFTSTGATTNYGVYASGTEYGIYSAGGTNYFSGNVGIGTTNPSQNLHISGNMRLTGALYDVNNEAGTSGQVLSSTGSGVDWIDAGGLPVRWSSLTNPNANLTLDHSTYTTTFNTSSTTGTFFTINANSLTSGKGLYLSSTSTGLTGNLSEFVLSGSDAGNTGNVVRIAQEGTSSAAVPLMVTNLGTGLSFRVNDETGDNDTTPFVIDSGGNVGLGTTNPISKLYVTGAITGKALAIFDETGDQDIFTASASGTTKFVIKNNGNVGIGTTGPGRKLDVVNELSVNNNLLTQIEGGLYYGRVRVSENQWALSNVGATWTERTGAGSRNWHSVSLSSDGKYQTAVVNGDYIYTSSDYGVTWTQRTGAGLRNWDSVSLSSDGKYQTAVVFGGYIYTSSDYGATWTERTGAGLRNWNSISLSSDGKYQTAVVGSGYIYTSSDYGATWTERTGAGSRNWHSVSLSSDGKYQTAVVGGDYIYTSSDYGVTWTQRTGAGSRNWHSVSLSSDGKYQTAVVGSGYIYTSSDYGATWTERTGAGSRIWNSISLSSDGKYQTAVVGGDYIYTSSDYGVTWTQRTGAGLRNWHSVSLSSDGKYQTAVVGGGYIYTSSADSYIFGGNVGIGTTSPSQNLHISGNMRLTGALYDVNNEAGTSGQVLSSTGSGVDWIDAGGLPVRWSSLTNPNANLTLDHSTYTTTFNTSSTTGTFFTINANSLTSGKGLYLSSTSTSLTGNLAEFVLSGSNASNTGNVVRIAQTGTSSAAVPLMITNLGTGLSFRVNDETGDNDTTPFVIDASGNVGIGTTSPGTNKLYVNGGDVYMSNDLRAAKFIDINGSDAYYLDPANGGNSLVIAGNIVSKSSTPYITGFDGTNYNTLILVGSNSSTSTSVCISYSGEPASCSGKIDAGTIDPPYTINGKKYATYVPSMTGIKEETTGVIEITSKNKKLNAYEYIIDFAKQKEGSDLWLFSKTTNLRKNIDKMTVLLTPSKNTRVWYKIDKEKFALFIYSTKPTTISYRLTAPRFDYEKWANENPNGPNGFVINDPDLPSLLTLDESGNIREEAVTLTSTPSGQTGDLWQDLTNKVYQLASATQDLIEEIGYFQKILVAKIQTGLLQAEEVLVNNLLVAKNIVAKNINLTTKNITIAGKTIEQFIDERIETFVNLRLISFNSQKIISPVVETTDLKATGEASLKTIATNEIKPQEKDLVINLNNNVGVGSSNPNNTGENTSPLPNSSGDKGPLARLIIKGLEGKTAAVIDASGNASFSGSLSTLGDISTLGNLNVNKNATISGTLSTNTLNATEASVSGKIIAKEIEAENINEIQRLLAEIKNQPLPDLNNQTNLSNTTSFNQLQPVVTSFNDLTVTGQSNLYNVSVSGSLLVGQTFIENNSIIALASELKLSALEKINLFDGAVTIAKDGTITTKGTLIAQGGIKTSTITPLEKEVSVLGNLSVLGSLSLPKATNSALIAAPENFAKNGIFAPAIEASAAAAGIGLLPANSQEVIIYNEKVTEDSLIYLTPTTPAPITASLVVSQKVAGYKPYFKVALAQPTPIPLQFNWLIIN